jgi:FkbM family methyltransferase
MKPPARSFSQRARELVYSVAPHPLYGVVADVMNWSYAARRLGLSGTLRFKRASSRKAGSEDSRAMVSVEPSNLLHPFYVRPGTTDVRSFLYAIAREAYGIYLPEGPVKYIVDAGANIGDTSAWFLTRFPEAELVAVEPDSENFAVLKRNSAQYGERLHLLRGAIWSKKTQMSVKATGTKDGVQVAESTEGECAAVTVPDIMADYGFPHIDIFKCDIEGAELPLFSENADAWLPRTRFIVIETHGADCLNAVVGATARHGFTHRQFRDLHIFEQPAQVIAPM